MLSARARNVLAAGFDLTDIAGTVLKVRGALATGVRWRNCGKKTLRELESWAGEPTVQANHINEELVERGAVAVLESRGYAVIPPNAELRRGCKPSPPTLCSVCGKPEDHHRHIKYGNDLDNPVKHEFTPND